MDFKKVSQAILQPTTPLILMKTLSNIYTLADLGPDIHIFAITGGPCSGKSTGMSKLYEYLTKRGYTVLVVPESATKLMQGGIRISDTLPPKDFQELILRDIIAQEQVFWDAARILRDQGQKVIVLCDRGTMDGEAYAGESVFVEIVQKLGLELATISAQRYHAVFHMRSAACGAEHFYTCSNNDTRSETLGEAAAIDEKTLHAWYRHHHLRVIDNGTGFEEKIQRLLAEICTVLGDPIPIEHEEKFVVDSVDYVPQLLERVGKVHWTDIVQTYLRELNSGESRRVRSRGDAGGTTYFYTTKVHIGSGKRIECERIISRKEYEVLLLDANPHLYSIRKRRGVFFVDGICYELDVFDDPHKGLVYLEVELTPPLGTPDQPRTITADTLPEVFRDLRLRRVTDDPAYGNLALAIPKE
ncbi:MAG: hypothetical protein RIQ72_237 [Candidatus Parcubacteria bacterium]|jgi:CYTH domain-containing protein/predicted ATPase